MSEEQRNMNKGCGYYSENFILQFSNGEICFEEFVHTSNHILRCRKCKEAFLTIYQEIIKKPTVFVYPYNFAISLPRKTGCLSFNEYEEIGQQGNMRHPSILEHYFCYHISFCQRCNTLGVMYFGLHNFLKSEELVKTVIPLYILDDNTIRYLVGEKLLLKMKKMQIFGLLTDYNLVDYVMLNCHRDNIVFCIEYKKDENGKYKILDCDLEYKIN